MTGHPRDYGEGQGLHRVGGDEFARAHREISDAFRRLVDQGYLGIIQAFNEMNIDLDAATSFAQHMAEQVEDLDKGAYFQGLIHGIHLGVAAARQANKGGR